MHTKLFFDILPDIEKLPFRQLMVESTLHSNAFWLYRYASEIIEDRWPEAEPFIMKDAKFAYLYANNVIRNRWPEAEQYIIKNAGWAHWYARNIIKDRWPEAEPVIMKDASVWKKYCNIFGID